METVDQTSTKTTGFTQMSLATLKSISAMGGGHNEMSAYIVLCSGVNGRQVDRFCTHGALSISKRTGMSYRTAEKALKWLEENNITRPPSPSEPSFLGKKAGRANTIQCVLQDGNDLDVAISKQFIDGFKNKSSPLKRILAEVDNFDDISRSTAVMDALILFASFIKEQDFADCAGVDPDAWNEKFVPIEDAEGHDFNEHLISVPNTNGVMVTVKQTDEHKSTRGFVFNAFAVNVEGNDEAHLRKRFWHSVSELRRLQLIYKVLILWDGNPLDEKQRKKAEPLGTLYVNDSWARDYDPFIQTETYKAAWRTGAREKMYDFDMDFEGKPSFADSGRYSYIIKEGREKSTFLVGQLRARWWASNESTVQGRAIEQRRTENMKSVLMRLR